MTPTSLPDHPALSRVAEQLARTRVAAAVCDHEWNMVWVGDDLKRVLGEWDDEKLGVGRHVLECFGADLWSQAVTHESAFDTGLQGLPRMAHDTPGGMDRVVEILNKAIELNSWAFGGDRMQLEVALGSMGTLPPEPLWVSQMEWVQRGLPPRLINQIVVRLADDASGHMEHIGFALIYASNLPANLLGLIARGDEDMLERMAQLYDPGPRTAAIMFADLESSGALSRRLSSATYFELIRAITTRMDDAIVAEGGIVSKHAGDGATAFFLADQCGSPSAAASAAIRAARKVQESSLGAAEELKIVAETECPMRVGLHWGPNLYMGQLVTGGRLEVTALGDEVNECARIEQSAVRGETLASKTLVEQLDEADAESLGLAPDKLRYTPLAEAPGATTKAIRDAGSVPVTSIAWSHQPAGSKIE